LLSPPSTFAANAGGVPRPAFLLFGDGPSTPTCDCFNLAGTHGAERREFTVSSSIRSATGKSLRLLDVTPK
jgi:hypothetical protein